MKFDLEQVCLLNQVCLLKQKVFYPNEKCGKVTFISFLLRRDKKGCQCILFFSLLFATLNLTHLEKKMSVV